MNAKTKKITLITVALLLCIIFTCCLAACGDPNNNGLGGNEGQIEVPSGNNNSGNEQTENPGENTPPIVTEAIGDYAYKFLTKFNTDFSKRKAASEEELEAAEYIKSELTGFGYNADLVPFTYTNWEGTEYNSQNVVAVKEGSDTSKQIIVGAHYDSVSAGNGIDDNASGVAALLESAKYYSDKTPSCNIVFVAFGAEEVGLKGSAAYVKGMTEEEKAKTKLMINIDSIAGGDKLYAYTGADEESQAILADLLNYGKDLGLVTQEGKGKDYGYGETGDWSDHANFKNAGIKFIYFEGTNWDCDIDGGETQYVDSEGNGYKIMHTSKDTLDWIEENFPGRAKKNVSLCVKSIINLTE